MKGKSQSQHEINKTKEKREVSFAEPVQRTRSLTREEANRGVREQSPEWSSTQQIGSGRVSRADGRKAGPQPKAKPELPVRARKLSKQEKIDAADASTLPKVLEVRFKDIFPHYTNPLTDYNSYRTR